MEKYKNENQRRKQQKQSGKEREKINSKLSEIWK